MCLLIAFEPKSLCLYVIAESKRCLEVLYHHDIGVNELIRVVIYRLMSRGN